MKFAKHLETLEEAWTLVDSLVSSLTAAVDDVERSQGASPGMAPLITRRRMDALRGRIGALVAWEVERAVNRSDRRLNGKSRRATGITKTMAFLRRVS